MNKNKKKSKWELIIILGLLFSIIGITFSFTAISRYVVIESNTKTHSNEYDLKIDFSSKNHIVSETPIVPITYPKGVKATYGYIDNRGSESIIWNLSAHFTEPGQKVIYKFYVLNSGKKSAYLKDIIFSNVTNTYKNKICVSFDGSNQAAVNKSCENIKLSIKVGKQDNIYTTTRGINDHILLRDYYDEVIVTIENEENSIIDDTSFRVFFGDILLRYSLID